ncbi:iroquois-class homeodomain protein irx-5 isoform X2 [Zeugodacus cucurbitae]|uniref:Homeobox protein Mohawk n=1 Tax=Zeugodacus cucurbitae TaxID=28588 RepID=A0A0A1WHG5_ZEUCU|nr:iroquois-class homeodomain protein irx-5 isoform X2 [Zeugodacus cucurbitae]XP_054083455.1 iroquois-class homeodomain protein irx-5 isoform X2 [Zeugodacus cucurbitae]XP_054083456.1 iroquois-class homeodomain protein irx-5 isoform X2 [Zeugodacus cucurbitae]
MEKFMTGRPQRNRRHSRRAWPPEDDLHQPRLVKRLFTPEIKRMLKDWLVRRRENPYPSRDEKKRLAIETGLTYTQICNWFANWRRKLKNSELERNKKSWGHLIKHYNTNARGNVEQFSISSEDSIWEEEELERDEDEGKHSDDDEYESREDGISSGTEGTTSSTGGCSYNSFVQRKHKLSCFVKNQPYKIRNVKTTAIENTHKPQGNTEFYGSTITIQQQPQMVTKPNSSTHTAKYKQKMMEKYLRDTNGTHTTSVTPQSNAHTDTAEFHNKQNDIEATVHSGDDGDGVCNGDNKALSKWLESAARFTPDKNNYFIEWNGKTGKMEQKQRIKQLRRITIVPVNSNGLTRRPSLHTCPTQLELDAAEALANMAFNCRQRIMDCNHNGVSLQTVNAISS